MSIGYRDVNTRLFSDRFDIGRLSVGGVYADLDFNSGEVWGFSGYTPGMFVCSRARQAEFAQALPRYTEGPLSR